LPKLCTIVENEHDINILTLESLNFQFIFNAQFLIEILP